MYMPRRNPIVPRTGRTTLFRRDGAIIWAFALADAVRGAAKRG